MTMKIIRHGEHHGKTPAHAKGRGMDSGRDAKIPKPPAAGAHKAVERLTAEVRHEHPLQDWGSKPGSRR